ncbi:hypothetical protein [Nonomuraea insulae]|uniref:Uncharacterized protein n=1 Tax=Nonomuraea insulae TaxID=1616787 RepID=A0ABW1DD40_9ACTN
MPEAKVEQRGGPVGEVQAEPFPARGGLYGRFREQRQRLGGMPLVGEQEQVSVGHPARTGDLFDRRLLHGQLPGLLHVSAPQRDDPADVQRIGQRRDSP